MITFLITSLFIVSMGTLTFSLTSQFPVIIFLIFLVHIGLGGPYVVVGVLERLKRKQEEAGEPQIDWNTLAIEDGLKRSTTSLHCEVPLATLTILSPEDIEQRKEAFLEARRELLSEEDDSGEIVIPVPNDKRACIIHHGNNKCCFMVNGPAAIRAMWAGAKQVRRQNIQLRWDSRQSLREIKAGRDGSRS